MSERDVAGPPPAVYEIRVDGHLDDHWSAFLLDLDPDLELTRCADGTTTLTGPIVDQARLHGLLASLRDMGATLLTLVRLDDGRTGQAATAVTVE